MTSQEQDPFSLSGKTVLVTGASSGIGRECCVRIAAAGGKVVATGRDADRLEETLQSLSGDGHRSICADITDREARASLAEETGLIDGIVHSAGAVRVAPIRYTKEKVLRELLKINTEAPIHLSREILSRKMVSEGGSLVFISSVSALAGIRGHVAYAASNAALLAAARPLATELASLKIRCNTLCPGLVETPMVQGGDVSEKDHRRQEKHYPLGFGRPEDVALTAVYFLSPASRWITGQTLALDGGLSILG